MARPQPKQFCTCVLFADFCTVPPSLATPFIPWLLTVSSILPLLDAHLPANDDAAWYRRPAIPAKKLTNAIRKYACDVPEDRVLALGDGTVFGSAKEGLVLTEDTLYCGTTEGAFAIALQDIVTASCMGGWPSYIVEL